MNSPRVVTYLHVYAMPGSQWPAIVSEICTALHESGLDLEAGALRLGVVGPLDQQAKVINLVSDWQPCEVVAAAATGFEQVTLHQLRRDALHETWGSVAYLHCKGVANPSEWADAWRRSMLVAMVGQWRACVKLLEQVQVVTCHWLAPEMDLPHRVEQPFPAGNMWHAGRSYLASLDPPLEGNRHDAEAWVGSKRPTVADLCAPGWPDWHNLFWAPR